MMQNELESFICVLDQTSAMSCFFVHLRARSGTHIFVQSNQQKAFAGE